MHLLVYVDGIVLIDKDNYLEWSRNIKHTLIFNDLLDDICEGQVINGAIDATITTPKQPRADKELPIWKGRDKDIYALIVSRQ